MKTAILLTAFFLAGCASLRPGSQADVDSILKDSAREIRPLPGSIVPIGTEVAVTLQVPRGTVQVQLSCKEQMSQLLYVDYAVRTYPSGTSRYAAPVALSNEVDARLRATPAIAKACEYKTDLRIAGKSEDDSWVLLDVSGLEGGKNDQIGFWLRFDYPNLAYDPPYSAPYGQKIERIEANCTARTFRLVAGFDLNAAGIVSDGALFPDAKPESFDKAQADYLIALRQVCERRAETVSRDRFTPRKKIFPDPYGMPKPNAKIFAAIADQNLTTPSRTPARVVIDGTTFSQRKPSSGRHEDLTFAKAQPVGLFDISTSGKRYNGQERSFLGMLPLASATKFSSMSDSSVVTELSFTGNWRTMPVGSQIGYRLTRKFANSIVGGYTQSDNSTCTIKREVPASTLHTVLVGLAKELECQDQGDKYRRVDTWYYFVDYGFAFHQKTSENEFFYGDSKISAFE